MNRHCVYLLFVTFFVGLLITETIEKGPDKGLYITVVVILSAITLFWWRDCQDGRRQRATAPPPDPKPAAPPLGPPPAVVFPLLQLHTPFTRAETIVAFRRRSMELHPDHGGNAALFRMLVAERKRAMEMAQ